MRTSIVLIALITAPHWGLEAAAPPTDRVVFDADVRPVAHFSPTPCCVPGSTVENRCAGIWDDFCFPKPETKSSMQKRLVMVPPCRGRARGRCVSPHYFHPAPGNHSCAPSAAASCGGTTPADGPSASAPQGPAVEMEDSMPQPPSPQTPPPSVPTVPTGKTPPPSVPNTVPTGKQIRIEEQPSLPKNFLPGETPPAESADPPAVDGAAGAEAPPQPEQFDYFLPQRLRNVLHEKGAEDNPTGI